MRGIKKVFFLSFFILIISVSAQNRFEFDYARFYNPQDSSSYIEIYYSFFRPALKTIEIDGVKYKQGLLEVKIDDILNNVTLVDNNWQLDIPVENNGENEEELMVGVLEFQLAPSSYAVDISASDRNNKDFLESSNVQLDFSQLPQEGLAISDIELASRIIPQSKETESIFYKNSIEVIPNPSLIYGDRNPVIFFYSEIYGLDEKYDPYTIKQFLYNADNETFHSKKRIVDGDNSSIVEIGAINANELKSGVYTLVVSISDEAQQYKTSTAKRVYVYNRDLIDESTDFTETTLNPLESELMMMSEDEINYMWQTARYIATEIEKDQWDKLSKIDSKRNFLAAFWERRDPDPSSNINLAKRDYYERVKYANDHFSNLSRKQGWKTDRGRVYIQYGIPDEIERFQNEYYTKPYEIWNYRGIEGGVIFLFADEEGLNIYRLVHSTKKGEIYNYRQYQKYVQ